MDGTCLTQRSGRSNIDKTEQWSSPELPRSFCGHVNVIALASYATWVLSRDVIPAAAQITYDTKLMLLEATIKQFFKLLTTYMPDVNGRAFDSAYL